MNQYTSDLQNKITELALRDGALLIGYTKIRRSEPVIILGFPFSDQWFKKIPFTVAKQLRKDYVISHQLQNKLSKLLKSEGYSAHPKTVLSLYGDFRPLAVSADIGDWGRNGLVVNQHYGSKLLFSAIFTNAPFVTPLEIEKTPSKKHCSDCGHCIEACPGNAFEGGHFHSHRCLPYLFKGCHECMKNCGLK